MRSTADWSKGDDAVAAICLSLLLMANSFTALFALMAAAVLVVATAETGSEVLLLGLWLAKTLAAAVACNMCAPSQPWGCCLIHFVINAQPASSRVWIFAPA